MGVPDKGIIFSSWVGCCWVITLLALACYALLLLPGFVQAEPWRKSSRLGKLMTGDDGIIYSCSDKFLYAFKSNGSMASNVHLNYTCNGSIAPVYAGTGKVYIIAENKVLRINCVSVGTSDPAVELFYGNESTAEMSDEILGLSASLLTSSVYINIKSKGLFAYSSRGRLRWSALPVFNQFGFLQGCKKNVTDCYFTSSPIIDSCESSLYISNNEGELYSISARSPRLKWIQNLGSFDKVFTVTPGNNGFLYVTVPTKAILLRLDVFTGDILWETNIGPLSSAEHSPVVDSNGWVSIGSLDGFLYSISPTGTLKKFAKASPLNSVIQVAPVLDCSGYAVYISQTNMEGKSSRVIGDYTFVSAMKPKNVVFSLLVPATEAFYWSETYPGEFASNLSRSDLKKFSLDEEIVLAFIAAAQIGNPLPCRSTNVKLAFGCSELSRKGISVYTGNERAILLFLLFETIILVVFAVIVRFCCIFWGKQKLQNQDLGKFLNKRQSLRLKKKEYDKTISELEQKAGKEATTSNVMENLSSLVREREGVERKLSTTYSLGRDRISLPLAPVLPVYDGSYSFRGSKTESVTIFHRFSSSTSSSDISGSGSDSQQDFQREVELAAKGKGKGKAKEARETTSSSSTEDNNDWEEFYGSSSRTSSGSRGFIDSFHNVRTLESGSRRPWLFRRRSLSSTY
ncbi:hypothetical protein BVRB_2g026290 isoform A [Beta vulgaris subsp. vulgaris]|nr:hypothetical protein BVRB_2g026290 isoform A [Beta vulgaris subsp. vulgaris]